MGASRLGRLLAVPLKVGKDFRIVHEPCDGQNVLVHVFGPVLQIAQFLDHFFPRFSHCLAPLGFTLNQPDIILNRSVTGCKNYFHA